MTTTFVRDPHDPCWGTTPFPEFITGFRDHQWDAFVEITNAFASGADVVLVDAPVGSGKTLIGEMVRRWFNQRALYVCSGKSLQDQFARDFPYARVLKGRSNYPTADQPQRFNDRFDPVTAADCNKGMEFLPACGSCPTDNYLGGDDDNNDDRVMHCDNCHPVSSCPYGQAKAVALASPLAVINTSYLLAEANSAGSFSKRPLVIVDECDMLEGELMNYFEVSITRRRKERYGIDMPGRKTATAGLREHDDGSIDWPDWFEHASTRIEMHLAGFPRKPTDRGERREVEYLTRLLGRLRQVAPRIVEGGWVYTGYDRGDITFKPVMVDTFGAEALWSHGDKWLLMSGTIIDPTEMVTSLGLPEDKRWDLVQVPMTFPVENRPVRYIPAAYVTAKNKEEAWPALAAKCNEIATLHPTERILVHSVSFALTQFLVDRLPRDRTVTYSEGREREMALARYKEIPNGILVGPSLDRGIDLPGDWCRVQIVCKLPFPYLGDKQISTRLYSVKGGQTWYLIQCVRSFVQMTGRGVRNDKDYAVTYVLDKAFYDNVWKKGERLLPKYLRDAVDWSGRLPKIPVGTS